MLLHSNLFQLYTVSSSPVDVPQVKYGTFVEKEAGNNEWSWSDVSNPIYKSSDKVNMEYLYGLFLHIKTILYAKSASLEFPAGKIFAVLTYVQYNEDLSEGCF